ncbi:MAG: hypothetical protein MUF34_12660, partial [Polyangiaceae bacterium]|nr:hypothetical protein [Polyangiaceae bacterium]
QSGPIRGRSKNVWARLPPDERSLGGVGLGAAAATSSRVAPVHRGRVSGGAASPASSSGCGQRA